MLRQIAVALTAATLSLSGWVVAGSGVGTSPAPFPATTPTPTPTVACPPALPITGLVTSATDTSLTISYSMLLTPPCGYHPPITVTLFASRADAEQWRDPVAEAQSGPERSGKMTVDGLSADTTYWFRFAAAERRDPYVGGPARTLPTSTCEASAVIGSSWNGGFVATITVRNVAAGTLDGWRVSWRWPGDERIQSLWGAVAEPGADVVAVRNAPYNGTLEPSGSTTFGMLVTSGATPDRIALTCGP
ncbi:cellulose binding domain-containing protein [Micromonospora sp. WMMD882]|uniref:cellulose binding domain-containing protein n=1 Tax=Micromonospora sp. WMMD882 TaxID=3015151 RepID=UPI00248BADDA|nr:cellulose binding domain-containing protein [Micromonospora sp. WMMD882]WBB81228.1 cellulose binding domain-containing protein [Micromonospora sp. WMMD882]